MTAKARLLLVHGVVSHSGWLESLGRRLAADGIDTVIVDRRGAGLNARFRGDTPSPERLLDDLDDLLAHLCGDSGPWNDSRDCGDSLPLHVGGFCWGANLVVCWLALRHALRVGSLVLMAPSLFPSSDMRNRTLRCSDSGIATEEPVMPIEAFTSGPMLDNYIRPDPLRLRRVSPRMNQALQAFSRDLWIRFLSLELPLCLIMAAQDSVVDIAATARLFERHRSHVKAYHLLSSAHGIQFDAEADAAERIIRWIAPH